LWLHEELVLLSIHPQKGLISMGTQLAHTAAGAGLTEMLLNGRVRLEKVKRSQRVIVVRTSMLGEPILDEWFERIRSSRKVRSPEEWLSRMLGVRSVPQRLTERLWFKSIVRREERTVLLFFKRFVHPLVNHRTRDNIVERMRNCLNSNCQPPARDAMLLGLAQQSNLLRTIFSSTELKAKRTQLKELVKAHPILTAVRGAAASHAAGALVFLLLPAALQGLAL
jgi:hypothetical protein